MHFLLITNKCFLICSICVKKVGKIRYDKEAGIYELSTIPTKDIQKITLIDMSTWLGDTHQFLSLDDMW